MAPSPAFFLAAVARPTTRLRLGPLVYILNLYYPLRLIEEIGMLDHLSGGRLELGIGRGVSPIELGFFGVGDEARERYEEISAIVLRGLTHSRLDLNGKYFTFEDVSMELSRVQKPHPPIWYGLSLPDNSSLRRQPAHEHRRQRPGRCRSRDH